MSLMIRPAVAADLDNAANLLLEAGLPVDDLAAEMLAFVAEENGDFRGIIGVEVLGEIALLRSLVVAGGARGKGVGPALVAALEATARADGVAELWLLTIDADAFFSKLGYKKRDRTDAPGAVRETAEFSSLCPDDAVLMSKRLDY